MTKNLRPIILLSTLMLAACSGVLTSEQAAKQYYTLMPLAASGGEPDNMELALTVSAVPGLDSDRIQALGPDARLNHYANARWPDHLPEVLASVIRRSLSAYGRFSFVEISDHAAPEGWLLDLEVRQFYGLQAASGETRSAIIEIAGSLTCNAQRHPIELSASAPVGAERLSAVVAAHQSALDAATRQLLDRIAETCS
jgi:ABC-type uncharacterized transport system auxiliary subunit